MRWLLGLLVGVIAFGSLNDPIEIDIDASTLSDSYTLACDSTTGYCLSGITNGGKLWAHFNGINQATAVVRVVTTAGSSSTVPSSTTQNRTTIWSYGTGTDDDRAVFNNLFVKLQGATTATGTIVLKVW